MANPFIHPSLLEPHFSTRLYEGFLNQLIQAVGEPEARRIVSETGVSWDYLRKDSNWVSEKFADLFFDRVQLAGIDVENFSYLAGKSAMSKNAASLPTMLASLFIDTPSVFKKIVYFSLQYNKVDHLEVAQLDKEFAVLRYKCRRESKHLRTIIQNWRGCLESVAELLGDRTLSCEIAPVSDGSYEFSIRWQLGGGSKGVGQLISVVTFLLCIGTPVAFYFQNRVAIVTCLSLLAVALVGRYFWNRSRKNITGTSKSRLEYLLHESEERFQELYESKVKLDRRYQEANLLTRVINRISTLMNEKELIETTLQEVKESLEYDRAIYMSFDSSTNRLVFDGMIGFSGEILNAISKYQIDLAILTPEEIHLGNVFKTGKSVLVPVSGDYIEKLSDAGKLLVRATGSKSFLMCSIATSESKFGVLLVDYCRDNKALTKDDLHIIQNLCNQLAICFENLAHLKREIQVRKVFERYVPTSVVQQLTKSEQTSIGDGLSREVTVVFTDIRNFTRQSSKLPPVLLVRALNIYLEEMTKIIYAHGGIVDKFLGDGILAVFNAFGDCDDHCARAMNATTEMQKTLPSVQAQILHRLDQSQYFELSIAMGVACGPAVVGNIGSEKKTEFTVLGETVNIASRLVLISKQQSDGKNCPIVVTESVMRGALKTHHFVELGVFTVRGYDCPTELYSLVLREDAVCEPKAA